MPNYNPTANRKEFTEDDVFVFKVLGNSFVYAAMGTFGSGAIVLEETGLAPIELPEDDARRDPTTFNEDTTGDIWFPITIDSVDIRVTTPTCNYVNAPKRTVRARLTGATDPDIVFVATVV